MCLETVKTILEERGGQTYDVMEALLDIQDKLRHLPEEALLCVSETLNVPIIEVFRLANFYQAFSLKPRGRRLVSVCTGTACQVQGAPKLTEQMLSQLSVKCGETTRDGEFTVETVNCAGACALAPLVIVDGRYHKQMTAAKLRRLLQSMHHPTQESPAHA
jgi:NADH-quinone oxidoreductase subunit E